MDSASLDSLPITSWQKNYSYSVILEPQACSGFTVLVPALPEVVTEGDNESEALGNAEEAIRAVLQERQERDMPPPVAVLPHLRPVTVAA